MARADAAIKHAMSAFEQHLSKLDAVEDRYSPAGLAEQIRAFGSTEAMAAVDHAERAVSDAADAAAEQAEGLRASMGTTVPADQRAAIRYWARTKGVLDAQSGGRDLTDRAQRELLNATPQERAVLLEELPAYLESRGVQSTAWIEAATRVASPDLAEAIANATKASMARDVVLNNVNALRRRINETQRPVGYRPPRFVSLDQYK